MHAVLIFVPVRCTYENVVQIKPWIQFRAVEHLSSRTPVVHPMICVQFILG